MDNRAAALREKLYRVSGLGLAAENSGAQGDVVTVLEHLVELDIVGDAAVRDAVAILRADGSTWQEVGDLLGVSRQSAHKTYGP